MSPVPGAGTPGSTGSPQNVQSPALPGQQTPYANGVSTPILNLPEARPSPTPPLQTPQPPTPGMATPQYTNATLAVTSPSQNGAMGPPQRPADKPTKEYDYDPMDTLAGTGIDLREEEQYMANMYSSSFDSEARNGYSQYPPGGKGSFYGAGPANQPPEPNAEEEQAKVEAQVAERAFNESAVRLAAQRTQEVNDPFLLVAILHRRAEKAAREHNLGLNLDLKNPQQNVGKMKVPQLDSDPTVTVQTKVLGPDQAVVTTTGSFIPHDAFLVDQMALLSIATKTRLRDLVEGAGVVAAHRQKTSHGEIPEEWEPAAAPLNRETPETLEVDGLNPDGTPADGAADRKRPLDVMDTSQDGPPKKLPKISSYMTTTMRELARQEREWEEARLRKRQKRKDGIPDSGSAPSRANSIAPGTPGSVAPEGEKAPTKKETKKQQAAKNAEANNHANQNLTSSMFAGLGGKSSLFGNKKKGKTYDWMNAARSGTSTPAKGGIGGKPSLGGGPAPQQGPQPLTTESRNRLGQWREDKEKGKNIQLRDWVAVLEEDGRESQALQRAYIQLDLSNPR